VTDVLLVEERVEIGLLIALMNRPSA